MLEALGKADTVRDAAAAAAEEYEQPQEDVERDMCELCRALLERDLIEIHEDVAD